jgi:3-methyladenine DNA glycosylase AlkD
MDVDAVEDGRYSTLIVELQARLDEVATDKTKTWWERYTKYAISFRGVKMPDIRSTLHTWYEEAGLATSLKPQEQKLLALSLLAEEMAEDKLAGILFLQEILIPMGAIDCRQDLPLFADLFESGNIFDWNTCDWFCVKVLGTLVGAQGEECAREICAWKDATVIWQRRASLVAFANLAKHGDGNFPGFSRLLLETCAALIQSRERFLQSAVGWILRELGRAEEEMVLRFVAEKARSFNREGLRYAAEKMPAEMRALLMS